MSKPPTKQETTRPCPKCTSPMQWTGLPDCSGPIYVRFFRCPNCGVIKIDVRDEGPIGWG